MGIGEDLKHKISLVGYFLGTCQVMFKRDLLKGLKLWRFGNQNFTYHGKLRRRSRQAEVDERLFFSLIYCGSSTGAIAAIYITIVVLSWLIILDRK